MRLALSAASPPQLGDDFDDRWNGPDGGVIAAWLRGLEMHAEAVTRRLTDGSGLPDGQDVVAKALRGELPILPWKGGVEETLKSGKKIGAMHYYAVWRGMRGEDLHVDLSTCPTLTCSRTGVEVKFTLSQEELGKA